ncbi:mechanosensitive ion channel [Desulfuromonas soudanensis]|uniref:Mechanosensitive ion channel n=1 Tax=Desulfuromonas soudanensis TaxID=1603606 RepID=A0A0M4CYX2_9BACT|nr:mechanosensitive ion channel domain-containing protein [Desulfuromonas soudanensis]ALC17778.1 mechanosensitive ion channel [Desulfuromonas soudanensis]
MPDETLKTLIEQFSFTKITSALVFFFMVWGVVWGLRILSNWLARKFSRSRLFIASFYPVLRLVLWVGAVAFIIFGIVQPPMNTLVAISAGVGLALGLGAQDLIRNIIAGILILFDRPFRVGDMVDVGGQYGEVTNIGLRSTRLQTFDDSAVTLPNALVLSVAVSNANNGSLDEMVVTEFHLPATVDVQEVKALAAEAAACSPYVYLKKPIIVMVDDHFDRAFLSRFRIKAYVLDVRFERLLASDILERVKKEIVRRNLLPEISAPLFLARSTGVGAVAGTDD